ncbi:hypothetical protein [Actinoplanes sp. CA-252034]|uniref:hypothetical protein n=1 Tax=Actinoplanes sp. CA-252034 TaxID=3239906 RepID=UPI003D990541
MRRTPHLLAAAITAGALTAGMIAGPAAPTPPGIPSKATAQSQLNARHTATFEEFVGVGLISGGNTENGLHMNFTQIQNFSSTFGVNVVTGRPCSADRRGRAAEARPLHPPCTSVLPFSGSGRSTPTMALRLPPLGQALRAVPQTVTVTVSDVDVTSAPVGVRQSAPGTTTSSCRPGGSLPSSCHGRATAPA